jgi:alkylhydroperoxidase/carboxymuconolactone decarboxylase family protein
MRHHGGEAGLPVFVVVPVDEMTCVRRTSHTDRWRKQMADGYYRSEDLARFPDMGKNVPDLASKFFDWYGAVFADGALSAREKSIIALAVAHAVQCPYCIDAYSRDALEKGADLDQMTEAVHVAAAIRGGASLVHGVQMRDHAVRLGM